MKLTLGKTVTYETRDGPADFTGFEVDGVERGSWKGTREEAESVVAAVNEREELIEALEAMVGAAYGVASESMNRARKQAHAVLDRAKESG